MNTSSQDRQWENTRISVRPYAPDDQEFVMGLAPRLLIGAAPWINPERMLGAVRQWIVESIARCGSEEAEVFVAEDSHQNLLGFASVARNRHFTGELQAYIGELAVEETQEGRGAGTALVSACEQWARTKGCAQVVLETGFANQHGRRFYERLGFREESVKLVRRIPSAAAGEVYGAPEE